MKVAIYTANFDDKDLLCEPLRLDNNDNYDFYCFVDKPTEKKVNPYKYLVVDLEFLDITKNARKLKILGHHVLKGYDITIWHDANFQMDLSYLETLISISNQNKRYITTFQHPNRNDFYSEAMTCVRVGKDNSLKLLKQSLSYFLSGLPAHAGLFSTGILIKNNQFINVEFLDMWWTNVLKYSRRDQLALCYVDFKKPNQIFGINDNIFQTKYAVYSFHKHNSYNYLTKKAKKDRFIKMSFIIIKLLRKLRKWK